jgi:Tfp pilus assembly protein FimV
MTPDEIRRSWDDDDTPRSVFPEPLAERLTRENKELQAEVERLRDELGQIADVLAARNREIAAAEARMDALVADLCGLHAKGFPSTSDEVWGTNAECETCGTAWPCETRAVLDKHAGEQP